MSIKIITVGKKHESWISEGVERYQKRLKRPFLVEWVFLPNSTFDGPVARRDDSERISLRLNASAFVILLDERGKNIDSPAISRLISDQLNRSREVIFVIGGAYGVDESVSSRADFVWSLSGLVFPHQLVRLILTEQIYRAQEIASGNPYHHE
jgi:23S rRNA (pseudouridine1915-N3)-methyltransferase